MVIRLTLNYIWEALASMFPHPREMRQSFAERRVATPRELEYLSKALRAPAEETLLYARTVFSDPPMSGDYLQTFNSIRVYVADSACSAVCFTCAQCRVLAPTPGPDRYAGGHLYGCFIQTSAPHALDDRIRHLLTCDPTNFEQAVDNWSGGSWPPLSNRFESPE